MKKGIIAFIALIILFFVYAYFVNPKGLEINEYAIKNPAFSNNYNGLKIVQFSDLLYGSTTDIDSLKKVVKKINELKPDVIFFTGDLISSDYKITDEEIEKITNELKKLDCNLYKYAVIGDNDKKIIEKYQKIMENSEFNLLDNSYTYLFYKEKNPLKIIGLTDYKKVNETIQNEENINPLYTIVLTHYSDNILNLNNENINLVLAGNSLGGLIRIPFVGGLIKKEGSNTYIDSFYEVNNMKLYINNGLGTEKVPLRAFNKPSITLYRLQAS